MNPTFSNEWFSDHQTSWDAVFEKIAPKTILEVGSYEGQSTTYIANKCCNHGSEPTTITCIDTWEGGREHSDISMSEIEKRYDYNMKILLSKYEGRLAIRKIKARSHDALMGLLTEGEREIYDFAYIDGSHDACDVLLDALLAFKTVRVGGVVCFDDFLWHSGDSNPLKTPRQGIESFISCFRDQIHLFDSGQAKQCWLQKKERNQ